MKKALCKKPGVKGEPHHVANIPQKYIDKFHDRLETQPNGCVFLKGNVQNNGYINWWYRYEDADGEPRLRFISAHRFSALISGKFKEEDVNEYCVLHDCDQLYEANDITYRQCVNPDCLWLGTVQDNIQDCINKGRYVKPPTHIGEDNYNATLTEHQAKFVIANHKKITQRDLAKIVGCSVSAIEMIHRNITWKHLPR
tara:strand:+ start:192 stop:785 length:594 start_codon:yes stop_codon:yes gene_type:complete